MQQHNFKYLVPALGLMMNACGGGSDNNIAGSTGDSGQTDKGYSQKVIDAKSQTRYLNLATGETVSSDAGWHVAFNRTSVLLNSGASGDGSVAGAVGDEQTEFYGAPGNLI